MLQNATPVWKSAARPPNSSENMSLVLRLPRKMHLCRSSSNVPCLPSFLEMLQNPHVFLTFDKVHKPLRLPHETTSERQKVVRACGAFNILHRNVIRATTACTFSTSQLPKVLELSASVLRNVLHATAACTCSTSQLLKVFRSWCALYILTCKYASRHNGVHFSDSSTSKSVPELRCFVHFDFEMCFALQWRAIVHLSSGQLAPHPPLERAYFSTLRSHKSLEKHSVSRLSYLLAHLDLLSSEAFSFVIFFLLLFSSLLFSDSSHLCCSSVQIDGSLTSKLPSMIVSRTMWKRWDETTPHVCGSRPLLVLWHTAGTCCFVSFYTTDSAMPPLASVILATFLKTNASQQSSAVLDSSLYICFLLHWHS